MSYYEHMFPYWQFEEHPTLQLEDDKEYEVKNIIESKESMPQDPYFDLEEGYLGVIHYQTPLRIYIVSSSWLSIIKGQLAHEE